MGRRPRRAGRRPRRAGWTTALGHRPARGRDRAQTGGTARMKTTSASAGGADVDAVGDSGGGGHPARTSRAQATRAREAEACCPFRSVHGPRPRGHEGTAFIERSQVMRGRAFRSGGLHSDCRRTVRAMRDDSLRLARPRGVGVAGSLDNSLRRRRVRSPGQQGTRGAPRCRRPAGRERQPGTAGPALFGLLGPCCNSPSGVVPQRGQMVDSREGFGPRGRALALTPARVVVRQGPAPRGRASGGKGGSRSASWGPLGSLRVPGAD